jgi:ribonuclease R
MEPSYEFDSDGHVTGVHYEAQTESHWLIEELMILANEQVAGYLAERKLPTLYRVHEKPDPDAVAALIDRLTALEVPTPAIPDNMSPQQAADIAGEASRLAAAYSRSTGRGKAAFGSMVLRSLKQAYYSPNNLGHAGLASPRYGHFTSPIRRAPDIVMHRALLAGLGLDDTAPKAHDLAEVGIAASETERAAMKIERGADDICSAFLLERRLQAEPAGDDPPVFTGEVVGLISKGAFIRFGEEGFEGMLPVRRLDGWWDLDAHEVALVHADSGRQLRLGDSVEVHVGGIDTARGRVDLEPAA